jgi:Protein of unknown function (DUF3515)
MRLEQRPRLKIRQVGVVVALTLLGLSGCGSGAVDVSPPSPDTAAATACDALAASLPDAVQDRERRETSPQSDLTAAWGDPAVVLRCGVPSPAAYVPTAELVEVNGVEWFPEELERGYRFTTYGRSAFVEVSVPDHYRPEVNALVDLAAAVDSAVPVSEPAEEW